MSIRTDSTDVEAYVGSDGAVVSAVPAHGRVGDGVLLPGGITDWSSTPLLDMALGVLSGPGSAIEFVWTGDASAPYWMVHMQRARVGHRDVTRLRARRCETLPFNLTKRELDIVTLLGAGMANSTIAESLGITTRTTTTHVDRVLRKMGAPSRSGVSAIAHDLGLFAVPLPTASHELPVLRVARVVDAVTNHKPVRTGLRRLTGADAPLTIGALVPVTGRAQADGAEMTQGAQLAVEEINARGGIHGRQLALEVVDVDVNSKRGTAAAVQGLMARRANAIAVGYLAHQADAVDLAAVEGVPYLHASASSAIDDVVASDAARYRGVFQVCPDDRNYATHYVKFLTELRDSGQWVPRSSELLVAAQSSWEIVDFGIPAATALAAEHGWDLVPLPVKDRRDSEAAWAEAAHRIGAAAAVMVGSYFVEDQVSFMRSFLARPAPALVYSIYAPSIPLFRQQLGDRADGLLWATTTGTYSDAVASEFVEAFTRRFGRTPGRSMAGIAYDRVNILAQAWSLVDDPTDYDAVADRIARTRYRGLNGSYAFRASGHGTHALGVQSNDPSLSQAHTTFQIQRGRNVLIGPHLYATGRFAPPTWPVGLASASPRSA